MFSSIHLQNISIHICEMKRGGSSKATHYASHPTVARRGRPSDPIQRLERSTCELRHRRRRYAHPVECTRARGGGPAGVARSLPHGTGLHRGLAPNRRHRRHRRGEIPTPRPHRPRHGLLLRRRRCRRGRERDRRGLAGEGGRGTDDLRGRRRRQLRHLLPPHKGKPSSSLPIPSPSRP